MIEQRITLHAPLTGAHLVDPASGRRQAIAENSADTLAASSSGAERWQGQGSLPPDVTGDSDDVVEMLESIHDAINTLEQHRVQSLDEMRELAIELAVVVASNLMYDAIDKAQYPIERLVDEAISHLSPHQSHEVTVRLNPEDVALLHERLARAGQDGSDLNKFKLQSDHTLNRGACEATVDEAGVLIDLKTKIDDLRKSLLGTLSHAESERRQTNPGSQNVRRFPDRRETA